MSTSPTANQQNHDVTESVFFKSLRDWIDFDCLRIKYENVINLSGGFFADALQEARISIKDQLHLLIFHLDVEPLQRIELERLRTGIGAAIRAVNERFLRFRILDSLDPERADGQWWKWSDEYQLERFWDVFQLLLVLVRRPHWIDLMPDDLVFGVEDLHLTGIHFEANELVPEVGVRVVQNHRPHPHLNSNESQF